MHWGKYFAQGLNLQIQNKFARIGLRDIKFSTHYLVQIKKAKKVKTDGSCILSVLRKANNIHLCF